MARDVLPFVQQYQHMPTQRHAAEASNTMWDRWLEIREVGSENGVYRRLYEAAAHYYSEMKIVKAEGIPEDHPLVVRADKIIRRLPSEIPQTPKGKREMEAAILEAENLLERSMHESQLEETTRQG